MNLKISSIMLIILAAVIFCCGCTGTDATTVAQDGAEGITEVTTVAQDGAEEITVGAEEITIGVLLPLSGDVSEVGEASKAALEVACEDINDHFASTGMDSQVRLVIEDTESNPAVALEKLKLLDSQGIRMVIGPGSSAELEAIRTYADQHGIIIVCTTSTAPSLAIEGDNVFRFASPDNYQADAMAFYLKKDGITTVVPVWRGDVWGDDLRNLTAAAFENRGGSVSDGVRYDPNTEDYTGVVEELDGQVGQAIAEQGKENVGVYAVTFDEVAAIMTAASETKNLTQVQWYGCDGNILLGSLTTPGEVAQFAEQTNFTGPTVWDYTSNPDYNAAYSKIQNRLQREPDGYCLTSYDTLWIVAQTGTQTDSMDVSELKNALTETAANTKGTFCSEMGLDAAGDRSAAQYWFKVGEGKWRSVPVDAGCLE